MTSARLCNCGCGQMVPPQVGPGKPRLYASVACKNKARNMVRRAQRRERKNAEKPA